MFMLAGLQGTTSHQSVGPWGVEFILPKQQHLSQIIPNTDQQGNLSLFLGNVFSSQAKMLTSVQVFIHAKCARIIVKLG